MDQVWITLITVFGGIIMSLVTYCVWKGKKNKNEKSKRDEEERQERLKHRQEIEAMKQQCEEQKELLNYVAGMVDVLNQKSISVNPEIRERFEIFAKRYHSKDLVKEIQ